ncbi:ATP-binding protein [Aliiruegeria lutimaris]|uniref:histidine kinase n=1 Tax=Aliiruegeria lutimaris TaxID=571298 RepID=A0A1G8W4Z3_9RHOB|nr:ATP-binding protein [Aliiruegeria lutimaris]SDJ73434.1 two-component system, OmpR family, phosphate regulon sensor histidine kinase PhoR [Aliiruegeria lutimaris]
MSAFSEDILAAIPMPLLLVGPDERIRAMNPAAVRLFSGSATGRHVVTVLRQPALLQVVERALRSGETGDGRYVDKNLAREATYKVRAAPVQDSDGNCVLLSFEDITDLEQAGEMRRDFVANVSHELKTPLTALLGFIETLRGAARNDPEVRERFLSIMEREAQRMNRLVSDLLSLSRVESAERQQPTDPVNIKALVDSTILSLESVASAENVRLITQRLDNGTEDLIVRGDRDQLQQVLTNLIENGIKYGRNGGTVQVLLSYSARELAFRGPGVQIKVVDDGAGFDPIHIPRLTERFYRVDNHRSREMGGTGLGLAIAKHIVNRHRGRFRIETEPGKGASFTVLLPALS